MGPIAQTRQVKTLTPASYQHICTCTRSDSHLPAAIVKPRLFNCVAGSMEQSDEYEVKIELPGWAQKDFMHFVEQLASSGGTQAPSHQLLPSLGLQPRVPASGFGNSSAHLATDQKASSTWPSTLASVPQGMHGSVPALMQRNANGGGGGNVLNRDVLQALDASTALDAADTTAGAHRTAHDNNADMHRERQLSEAEACGSAQPLSEIDKEDAHECAEIGSSSMHTDDVANFHAVLSSIAPDREGNAAAQSSRANGVWLPGAQYSSGMAELDAATTVPALATLGASTSSTPAVQPPSAEYGTLPPITPLGDPRAWALGKGWVPPWPYMHAHEACDGPVHASVCDNGGLRCVVWERRGRRSVEQQCEAVEESEMLNSGAGQRDRSGGDQMDALQGPERNGGAAAMTDKDTSAADIVCRKSLKTAPAALMWCRDTSSSAVGGVRLQGVRKRPPGGPVSSVPDAHKPKRPHRSDVSGAGPCTRGDIQRLLFGPVEAIWFQAPLS